MFILGSSSVARYDLLVAAGLMPDKVVVPNINEAQRKSESPTDYVRRMAIEKVTSLKTRAEDILLTADTVVVSNRVVLHKTSEREIARNYIKSLSGKRHRVFTAVAIKEQNNISCFLVKTTLKMKRLCENEIDQYLNSEEWVGKAGGYSIQGRALSFFTFISGCYSNVVGLPIPKITNIIGNKFVRSEDG